jgi:hypothetical protein
MATDFLPSLQRRRGSGQNRDTLDRHLQMLYQNQDGSDGSWECQNMDIVSACRGTSVSQTYMGNFEVYHGPCKGNFVEELPIYRSTDRPNQPLYIYPIDYYPDNWSFEPLRGLVRWRIASFQNFNDKESCRIETSNIFQIEFAADGHPYDYYPTIYCFDENSGDTSGYQTSNINIRCNDVAPATGSGSSGIGGPEGLQSQDFPPQDQGVQRQHAGAIIVALGFLMIIFVAGIFIWNRCKERRCSFYAHPQDSVSGIMSGPTEATTIRPRAAESIPSANSAQFSTHSRFQDEPDDLEQPSYSTSAKRTYNSMFTVRNLRSQLNESSHALRDEVRELWNSLHSK